jgi:hypothetical protein
MYMSRGRSGIDIDSCNMVASSARQLAEASLLDSDKSDRNSSLVGSGGHVDLSGSQ